MAEQAKRLEQSVGRHAGRHIVAPPAIEPAIALLDTIAAQPFQRQMLDLDQPLGLYGGGNLGALARDYLDVVGRKADFVVDRNADTLRADPAWAGFTFYHPDVVPDALKRSHMLLVTVATSPFLPLEVMLIGLGFETIVPFYDFAENFRHLHPLSNGWFAAPFGAVERENIAAVLEGLADERSRAALLQFIAWRRLREEWTFTGAEVTGDDRFFIPEIMAALGDTDLFIDAGAHHGGVSLEFDRRRGGRHGGIVAIEPDHHNLGPLTTAFKGRWPGGGDGQIEVQKLALGADSRPIRFHSGLGYASQISETGADSIETVPIDALALKPGFIKLHLEGGELDALKGARQTILRHRPVLAATIYHNDDGLWRSADWLMANLSDYSILFRLHSWCGTGAVLYAIPNERSGHDA
jgi:FkbM family methyltransferase